jgi:hypothetical protein
LHKKIKVSILKNNMWNEKIEKNTILKNKKEINPSLSKLARQIYNPVVKSR